MPFRDGQITSRRICVGAITERTIADGAVTTDKIADGALTVSLFDNGIQPVQYVAVLPLDNTNGDLAFLTTNGKLYRWSGGAWTVAVDGTDIVNGSIVASDKIVANSITAGQIAANTITAGQIAAGAIATSELDAFAVTADKIAANTITAGQIAAGTITATQIASDTITGTNLAAINLAVGNYIRSTSYTAGVSGWSIDAAGSAEFNNVTVRGTLATSSIAGNLTMASGTIRTASSGRRMEIFTPGTTNDLGFYTGMAAEQQPGYMYSRVVGGVSGGLYVAGPVIGTVTNYGYGFMRLEGDTSGTRGYASIVGQGFGSYDGEVNITAAAAGSGGGFVTISADDYVFMNTPQARIANGNASVPSLGFNSDSDTGIYLVSAGVIGFTSGTTKILEARSSGLAITPSGSVTAPAIYFATDSNTGIYRIAENTVGIAVGGAVGLNIGPTADKYIYGLTTGAGSGSMQWNSSTGQITYQVSSRTVKKHIRTFGVAGLTDGFRVVTYRMRKSKSVDDPNRVRLGLIAEEVIDVDPRFGVDPGGIPNYDDRAVLAAVIADLQDARRRIAELESVA